MSNRRQFYQVLKSAEIVFRPLTDPFAFGVKGCTGEQIILFDDVFKRLVTLIDVPARAHVGALHNCGTLDEWEVANFAAMGKFEETTAALAVLSGLPIETVERAMLQERPEMTTIIAKALGLSWQTLKTTLTLRCGDHGIGSDELEQCVAIFTRLKPDVARQVVEFERKRGH